jgi:peptidoglycan-N-acetylglucosamine deacetylase
MSNMTPINSPVLTVQVDVDGLTNLRQFYGLDVSTEERDTTAYRLALPRFAEFFESLGVRATFFVIGEDLTLATNRDMVRQLYVAGHEIANHTQTHPYHFNRLSRQHKHDEIAQAGKAIESITGHMPVGFRAPGYDVDGDVLDILTELGYRYDSSVMPSVLNLPAKVVHMLLSKTGNFSGYGSMALSVAPNRPYRPARGALWRSASTGSLWELPVSCVPYVRLPFYANFNLFAGDGLFRVSAALAEHRHCNYVFHAVEMLDPTEIDPRLHHHPNARLPLSQKIARCRGFLRRLQQGRRVLLSQEFAAEFGATSAATPTSGAR